MAILRFYENDRLQMKKKHPCGGSVFRVLRVGSDVRVVCERCGRDVTVPREKLEKNIKKIIGGGSAESHEEEKERYVR